MPVVVRWPDEAVIQTPETDQDEVAVQACSVGCLRCDSIRDYRELAR
jgi:hypothetical protein